MTDLKTTVLVVPLPHSIQCCSDCLLLRVCIGADGKHPGDKGCKSEILTLLFCQPLSCKAITTLSVLTSGYWDQQGNKYLLSSSPVILFNLGSRPTSDHKNGFPGLDNPENRWQSCYGCSTEPSTDNTHCSHSDHSSAGTVWMSFHPSPHWCSFLLMQGRDLCFSVLQWHRQEGALRAVVHMSRASNTCLCQG